MSTNLVQQQYVGLYYEQNLMDCVFIAKKQFPKTLLLNGIKELELGMKNVQKNSKNVKHTKEICFVQLELMMKKKLQNFLIKH